MHDDLSQKKSNILIKKSKILPLTGDLVYYIIKVNKRQVLFGKN